MSLKKFGQNDVILNTMNAHPSCEFFIYDGLIRYNNIPQQSGAFSASVLGMPPGHISLYEYNVDKLSGSNNIIYPFITKGSDGMGWGSISDDEYHVMYEWGDTLASSYPMSASIVREFMSPRAGGLKSDYFLPCDTGSGPAADAAPVDGAPLFPRFYSLKNRLNFYGARSLHYRVTASTWNKSEQAINMISIPSIFFGSRIDPGSISLKWYFTGSLIGELQDLKRNGELIQVGPAGSTESGSVAGVVMYDEGFILLTGSWDLNNTAIAITSASTDTSKPSWLYYAAGAQDGVTKFSTSGGSNSSSYGNAAFGMSFKGETHTQVMTMFAHARRGEVNYSNNPTYLKYGQDQINESSSQIYEENSSREVANTVSSSYSDYSASFKRQVYVSRVAIYDDSKNLIGVATLSNPILKEEDQDLTFKIRLDI
jgi:hypothetical protein